MSLIKYCFFSQSLQMQTEINIVIPTSWNDKKQKTKCLYLLHGLGDNNTVWLRQTAIERYAEEFGIFVVMPCGGKSFYFNQSNGENYYTYISKELPNLIKNTFNVSFERENTFIAGNSMGGYGALKIALKESDSFCAAAGLSSVADIKTELFKEHLSGLLNEKINNVSEDDLYNLIIEKENKANKPRLYMWCGTEDFLYEDNIKFKEYMKNRNYDFTYRECEGGHSWTCWDKQIVAALNWMLDNNN